MGIRQVLVDDLDGKELPSDTKAQTVTFEGKKYEVYLSAKNTERFVDFLTGVLPLTAPASNGGSSNGAGNRTKTETYGYDYQEVKAWAIAKGIKGKTGAPVTESTTRIGQTVYDAYHAAQK
jgi:hypothetical protein